MAKDYPACVLKAQRNQFSTLISNSHCLTALSWQILPKLEILDGVRLKVQNKLSVVELAEEKEIEVPPSVSWLQAYYTHTIIVTTALGLVYTHTAIVLLRQSDTFHDLELYRCDSFTSVFGHQGFEWETEEATMAAQEADKENKRFDRLAKECSKLDQRAQALLK